MSEDQVDNPIESDIISNENGISEQLPDSTKSDATSIEELSYDTVDGLVSDLGNLFFFLCMCSLLIDY